MTFTSLEAIKLEFNGISAEEITVLSELSVSFQKAESYDGTMKNRDISDKIALSQVSPFYAFFSPVQDAKAIAKAYAHQIPLTELYKAQKTVGRILSPDAVVEFALKGEKAYSLWEVIPDEDKVTVNQMVEAFRQ